MSRLQLGRSADRGAPVDIVVDGIEVRAYEGETVAAVLIAEGDVRTRHTVGGAPRGIYCGIGVCFDCLVVVDDVPNTRACMTLVRPGMRVSRQEGLSARTHAAAPQ